MADVQRPFAFSQKNDKDFKNNSIKIENAIQRLRNDAKLPITLAQLGKLSKLHVNTLRNRSWTLMRRLDHGKADQIWHDSGVTVSVGVLLTELKSLRHSAKSLQVPDNATSTPHTVTTEPGSPNTQLENALYENTLFFHEKEKLRRELDKTKSALAIATEESRISRLRCLELERQLAELETMLRNAGLANKSATQTNSGSGTITHLRPR